MSSFIFDIMEMHIRLLDQCSGKIQYLGSRVHCSWARKLLKRAWDWTAEGHVPGSVLRVGQTSLEACIQPLCINFSTLTLDDD